MCHYNTKHRVHLDTGVFNTLSHYNHLINEAEKNEIKISGMLVIDISVVTVTTKKNKALKLCHARIKGRIETHLNLI